MSGFENIFQVKNLKQPCNEIDFGGEEIALLPPLSFNLTDTWAYNTTLHLHFHLNLLAFIEKVRASKSIKD